MRARLGDFVWNTGTVLAVPFTKGSSVPINKGCCYMRPEMYFVCFHPFPCWGKMKPNAVWPNSVKLSSIVKIYLLSRRNWSNHVPLKMAVSWNSCARTKCIIPAAELLGSKEDHKCPPLNCKIYIQSENFLHCLFFGLTLSVTWKALVWCKTCSKFRFLLQSLEV